MRIAGSLSKPGLNVTRDAWRSLVNAKSGAPRTASTEPASFPEKISRTCLLASTEHGVDSGNDANRLPRAAEHAAIPELHSNLCLRIAAHFYQRIKGLGVLRKYSMHGCDPGIT